MLSLVKYVRDLKILVAAHRGASGSAPENTISAFSRAIDCGVDMIEADIQETRDGELITFHDEDLARTAHNKRNIRDFDYPELKDIDAGSWFGKEYAGEKIPLLREVLDLAKDKVYVAIEIKSSKSDNPIDKVTKVLEQVKLTGTEKQVVFASFDYRILKIIADADRTIPYLALRIPGDTRLPSALHNETGCYGIISSKDEIDMRHVLDAEPKRLFLAAYGVDEVEDLDNIIELGIGGIGTNYPEKIIPELKKRGLK